MGDSLVAVSVPDPASADSVAVTASVASKDVGVGEEAGSLHWMVDSLAIGSALLASTTDDARGAYVLGSVTVTGVVVAWVNGVVIRRDDPSSLYEGPGGAALGDVVSELPSLSQNDVELGELPSESVKATADSAGRS